MDKVFHTAVRQLAIDAIGEWDPQWEDTTFNPELDVLGEFGDANERALDFLKNALAGLGNTQVPPEWRVGEGVLMSGMDYPEFSVSELRALQQFAEFVDANC